MLILLPQPSYAASLTPEETPEIIWAVDVSGSVRQTDAEGFWREAVLLGADILPLGAKMGFVAANTGVVAQISPQPDMTHAQWETVLETVPINGDTDLSAAVKAALALFDESAAKRIILVGDISEGGFFAPGIRPADKLAELDDLAQELKARGARLDCIFLGAGRAEQAALDVWWELAEQTGGAFTLLSQAAELTDAAAEAYFTVYPYARAVTGSLNTTAEWQTVQIALPDAPLEKARVFIPHAEVKTQAAGLNITAESSYALLTFAPPLPENLSLEIRSAAPAAYISLIADGRYTLDAARETVFAGRTLFQSGVQEETITLSLTGAGGAIFTPGADSDFMITAFYVTPEGQEVSAPLLSAGDGTFVFSFRPETFGDYTVRFTAGWQDAEVISAEAPLAIQPVEPPMPAGPILLAALAAVAAVVIWRLTRRRSLEPGVTRQSIPLLAPEQPAAFTGRLDIYAVVTEGGKTELPGMSVSPRGPSEVTLSELFKQSGVTLHYEKADAIKVRPGNDAIVLRNGGGADILFMGRSIAKGQETVLRFGQKIYIVLNKDEDEFEIYYNRADEASGSGLRV